MSLHRHYFTINHRFSYHLIIHLMKKILLTLLFTSSIILAKAQIGITAGGNIAKYSYTSNADRKFIFGFNGGLFYNHNFGENFAIQPELLYTVKGATLYTEIFIGSNNPVMKYQNRLKYVQFSLPVMRSFEVSDEFDFDFGLGVFVGYLTSADYTAKNFDGTSSKGDFKIGNGATDSFKALDYGASAKIGFTMSKTLGFHFRYEAGLADLSPTPNDPKLKTGNMTFNISYIFGSRD